MISTFGRRAEPFVHLLPAGTHAVVFTSELLSFAAREALARRERGERFYGLALVDDLRVATCNAVAPAVAAAFGDHAQRQVMLGAVGRGELAIDGKPAFQRWSAVEVEGVYTKMNAVLCLCDELLVRSTLEYRRYAELPTFPGRAYRRILLPGSLPPFERRAAVERSVLVWTGRRADADATIALLGLEVAWSAAYVGDAPLANVGGRFISRADAAAVAQALGTAACIVCVDPSDPADAVALARLGIPVVAPSTCAAYEFTDGVVSWDAADGSVLGAAVNAALAGAGTAGVRTAAVPLVDDARVRLSWAIAQGINADVPDAELRYFAALSLARGITESDGRPIAEAFVRAQEADDATLRGALADAGALLVRTNAEYAAHVRRSGGFCSTRLRRVALTDHIPAFERCPPSRPSCVVWTGRRPATDATLALIGLEEFRGDVSYVAVAPLPHVRGRWIAPDDPAVIDALAVAGCVICIDPSDPSDAVAFARRDLPVVAPVTSAAYEFVDGIVSWDAANGTTVSIAAAFAMGRVAHGTLDDRPAQPPAPSLAAYADRLPLVTVLTATYNRRSFLRRMLTCLAAQTYPNIESLIVNDAGEPVEDIVAEFPFARLINAPVNGGTYFRTARLGLREARGEYLAMLPDDDWFYPDHIERLMIAILRTGAAVAHSFAVMRFLRTDPDGTEVTFGINPQSYASSVTPTIALQGTPIALPQCIQRRDTFDPDDVGWPLTDAVGSDQEYHMRLLKRHQLVAVDRFTSEFRDHAANSGKAHNWAEAMRYIYDEVQPVRAGSITALYREQALERLRAVRPGQNVAEPVIRFHLG